MVAAIHEKQSAQGTVETARFSGGMSLAPGPQSVMTPRGVGIPRTTRNMVTNTHSALSPRTRETKSKKDSVMKDGVRRSFDMNQSTSQKILDRRVKTVRPKILLTNKTSNLP